MTAQPASSTGIRVVVEGLTRSFPLPGNRRLDALGPIDVTFEAGEFFSIIGPSGCGKSTLLDIVAGLSQQSAGRLEIDGADFAGRRLPGIGVVFQEDASFPWLSVHDNVAFGLRRRQVDAKQVEAEVGRALALMGLTQFRNARPTELSGGMRQRMCIARTLVLRPRLLLLDEPFGALDQQTRLIMGDELLKLWRETGATVLLITHSLDEAAMLSDRIGIMSSRPGRLMEIVETGWPADRDSRVAALPEFGAISARLWERLRGESLKAMDLAR